MEAQAFHIDTCMPHSKCMTACITPNSCESILQACERVVRIGSKELNHPKIM